MSTLTVKYELPAANTIYVRAATSNDSNNIDHVTHQAYLRSIGQDETIENKTDTSYCCAAKGSAAMRVRDAISFLAIQLNVVVKEEKPKLRNRHTRAQAVFSEAVSLDDSVFMTCNTTLVDNNKLSKFVPKSQRTNIMNSVCRTRTSVTSITEENDRSFNRPFTRSQYDPRCGISKYVKPENESVHSSIHGSAIFTGEAVAARNINGLSTSHILNPTTATRTIIGSAIAPLHYDEKIVGSCTYAPFESGWATFSRENEVEIRMLAASRIEGIAESLIRHCIEFADWERRKCVNVMISKNSDDMELLYRRLGFKRNFDREKHDKSIGDAFALMSFDLGHKLDRHPTIAVPEAHILREDFTSSRIYEHEINDDSSNDDHNNRLCLV